MLWRSGDMLVKAIETFPALAIREVLLYFSWPSGLASRLNAPPVVVAPLLGAGGDDFAELDVVRVTGRALGLGAGARGAGARGAGVADVMDVGVLDVLGVFGLVAGVEAGGLGAVAVAVVDVVGVTAALVGVNAEELVLLDEPPQPANASRPTARMRVESLDTERDFA